MRIFDELKINELKEYDSEKGYLKFDKLLIAHHAAVEAVEGKSHMEVVAEYPSGGKVVEEVWDIEPVEAKEAWDEYEDIQVYVPYTEKELAQIEINTLKGKLAETDYQSIRDMAKILLVQLGSSTESIVDVLKSFAANEKQRQEWRDRINELEEVEA